MMQTDESIGQSLRDAAQSVDDKRLIDLAQRALIAHFRLLYAWNQRINLTGVRDPIEGVERHLVESVKGGLLLEPRATDQLVDLGSGNGFPGLAVLLLHPQLRGVLIEKSQRKVDFLRAAIRQSGATERVGVSELALESVRQLDPAASVFTLRGFPAPRTWIAQLLERPATRSVLAWLGEADAAAIAGEYAHVKSRELGEGKYVTLISRHG
jgi:16S rRNA (guanine527-N7)-methyltransferase